MTHCSWRANSCNRCN